MERTVKRPSQVHDEAVQTAHDDELHLHWVEKHRAGRRSIGEEACLKALPLTIVVNLILLALPIVLQCAAEAGHISPGVENYVAGPRGVHRPCCPASGRIDAEGGACDNRETPDAHKAGKDSGSDKICVEQHGVGECTDCHSTAWCSANGSAE